MALADLDDAPLLLTLPEVALIYRIGISTLRQRIADGTFSVKPYEEGGQGRAYRWRRVDIAQDLVTLRRGRPKGSRAKRRRPS